MVGPLEVLDVWRLNLSATDLVQPLHRADSHLLQVLVRKFNLSRRGPGVHVTIKFDRDSPAIWRREARIRVRQHLSEKQKREYQDEIDAVVEGKKDEFDFTDSDFPFRHANGGVLPIIQVGDKSYYCLFYRETDPIGWNIANGGSDDSDELIDPQQTILRELREELIMVGPPSTNERYTLFKGDKGAHNRPEYLKALDLWRRIVGWPSLDRRRKHDIEADVEWENAPDFVTVLAGDYGINEFCDVYVNITTKDCAIEVDRVAILRAPVDFNFRLLDGEVYGGTLVNRPIGLFETSNFNAVEDLGSPAGEKEFEPNTVFYSGALTDEPIRDVVEKHLVRQRNIRLVTEDQAEMWNIEGSKLKLCPITRSIINRRIRATASRG